jgi:hypothetical protein
MKKKILLTIFCSIFLFGVPFVRPAYSAVEIIDNDIQNVSVSVSGNTLHVVGANGQALYIFNVAGVCVTSFKVEGNDKHYDLNLSHGCYIVKVGKTVRKISVS